LFLHEQSSQAQRERLLLSIETTVTSLGLQPVSFSSKRLQRICVSSFFFFLVLQRDRSTTATSKSAHARPYHNSNRPGGRVECRQEKKGQPFGTCGGRPHCAHPRGGRWILRSPRAAMRPRGPSVAASAGRGRWGLGPPAEFVVRSIPTKKNYFEKQQKNSSKIKKLGALRPRRAHGIMGEGAVQR